jgi:hypothetical protein
MPSMQAMVERLNMKFNRENISLVPEELLLPDADLVESAEKFGIANPGSEVDYLKTWPPGLLKAVQAALLSARQRSLPVQFVWVPAYQYEVNSWEVAGTRQSLGGMSMVLKSPLP